ncbi:hypothetical protein TI39_contig426g00007 [Zymoseptoria brevis]|uniref:RING-type domain-containing protein n=1 Tax=Zymoseptoria brevis TaxID=1047168 RepID=A0A0F4GLE6_9PEZI|nr:hypothetical protein TI39_contig426g00007 [Zymoseptoria brevis]
MELIASLPSETQKIDSSDTQSASQIGDSRRSIRSTSATRDPSLLRRSQDPHTLDIGGTPWRTIDGSLVPSVNVGGDQRVSMVDRASTAQSRSNHANPHSSRIVRAQHRRRLLLGTLPPLIIPPRVIPTEEQVFHRQETIWQPIVVRLPNSLQELRGGLLNTAQQESLHHWQEHEFELWFQTTPAATDRPDDHYEPLTDTDPVATWYIMARIYEMRNQVDTAEDFEAPSWTYANPLYTEEQSEEEIIASLPLVTITASLPTAILGNDDAAEETVQQKHKIILKCMKECRICGEAILLGYGAECGHVSCVGEMIEWLKFQSSCPDCRKVLKHEDSCLVRMDDAEEATVDDLSYGGADRGGDVSEGW